MPDAQLTFRRIVTGHDASGRSTIMSEDRVTEGGAGNFDFWRGGAGSVAAAMERQPFFPRGPGESFFRIFRIPADRPGQTLDDVEDIAAQLFDGFGISECRVDTNRHPMMHETPTTDFVLLLSGQVSLLLDDGEPVALKPFDVVVQRATNHAWINTGRQDAILAAILLPKS